MVNGVRVAGPRNGDNSLHSGDNSEYTNHTNYTDYHGYDGSSNNIRAGTEKRGCAGRSETEIRRNT